MAPYDDLPDDAEPWDLARVGQLWQYLRTLWPQISVASGHEQAAGRTWAAMLADVTPWEVGRAATRMASTGVDRCPVVGVLANAARVEADDRIVRHPPALTEDQLRIRQFLAAMFDDPNVTVHGGDDRMILFPQDRFSLKWRALDDYAAGRMSLSPVIHALLDEAGLLPDHWRSPV